MSPTPSIIPLRAASAPVQTSPEQASSSLSAPQRRSASPRRCSTAAEKAACTSRSMASRRATAPGCGGRNGSSAPLRAPAVYSRRSTPRRDSASANPKPEDAAARGVRPSNHARKERRRSSLRSGAALRDDGKATTHRRPPSRRWKPAARKQPTRRVSDGGGAYQRLRRCARAARLVGVNLVGCARQVVAAARRHVLAEAQNLGASRCCQLANAPVQRRALHGAAAWAVHRQRHGVRRAPEEASREGLFAEDVATRQRS